MLRLRFGMLSVRPRLRLPVLMPKIAVEEDEEGEEEQEQEEVTQEQTPVQDFLLSCQELESAVPRSFTFKIFLRIGRRT